VNRTGCQWCTYHLEWISQSWTDLKLATEGTAVQTGSAVCAEDSGRSADDVSSACS